MDLTAALGLGEREVVALVGGGGKTTTMYRLCAEATARQRQAVATGTARFTLPARGSAAPLIVEAEEAALLASVRVWLGSGAPWLIVTTGHGSQGRLLPVPYETVAALAAAPEIGLVAIEADASALRPSRRRRSTSRPCRQRRRWSWRWRAPTSSAGRWTKTWCTGRSA